MNRFRKAISCILVCSALCIIFSLCTFAAASFDVSGPSTVRAGDTIKLKYTMVGDNTLMTGFTLKFDASLLTYSSSDIKLSGWEFDGEEESSPGTVTFVFSDSKMSNAITGSKEAFTLTFKVKSSVPVGTDLSVRMTDIVFTDLENETNAADAVYSVKTKAPLSSDCTLSSLSLDNAKLSPAFSPSKTEYTATVDHTVTSVKVTAKANDSGAKVTVSGGDSLKTGKNTVTVTVKAEDGSTKKYTVTVTKSSKPLSDDCTLSSLSLDKAQISPAFSSDKTSYTATVDHTVSSLKVTYKTNDSTATVTVSGADRLKTGENTVTVTVKAENGDTKKYTVKVTKTANPNGELDGDCTLNSLVIEGAKLDSEFSSDKTEYTATVESTVNSLKVDAVANSANATVTVSGNENLVTGENIITVTVEAENGDINEYKITVTKAPEGNSDSTLKSISLSVGILSPAFSPDRTEYIVYLPYEIEEINLEGVCNDEKASVENAGGTLVKGKNEFSLVCTAENGAKTEYKVTVMRMPALGDTDDTVTDTPDTEDTTADTDGQFGPAETLETEPDTT